MASRSAAQRAWQRGAVRLSLDAARRAIVVIVVDCPNCDGERDRAACRRGIEPVAGIAGRLVAAGRCAGWRQRYAAALAARGHAAGERKRILGYRLAARHGGVEIEGIEARAPRTRIAHGAIAAVRAGLAGGFARHPVGVGKISRLAGNAAKVGDTAGIGIGGCGALHSTGHTIAELFSFGLGGIGGALRHGGGGKDQCEEQRGDKRSHGSCLSRRARCCAAIRAPGPFPWAKVPSTWAAVTLPVMRSWGGTAVVQSNPSHRSKSLAVTT